MIEIRQTETFAAWFNDLRDRKAKSRIAKRLTMVEGGHFGDVKLFGDKVWELRIDYGPGYRLYFTRRGEEVILLLIGGDKGSQDRDIARAKKMVAALK